MQHIDHWDMTTRNLRRDTRGDPGISPSKMIGAVVFVFVISLLGAAFTPVLQSQVTNWSDNLTAEGQTGAATVVGLIPLLFWILLAVGIILGVVAAFLPGKFGL